MTSATTIILVLYVIQGSLGHGLPQSPIVGMAGGHVVDIANAPFMAAVLVYFPHTDETKAWCAGSIIHDQFVLTSATCTFFDISSITVRVGSTRYDEGGELHQVEKYITHESYSDARWYLNNVALLKLSEPVTFGPTVAKIKLADASVNIPVGFTANVTGWGQTNNSWVGSRELLQASVTVSPHDGCNDFYNPLGRKITDQQFCVNNEATGACYLDTGAPVTAGRLQIGIYTYGESCMGEPTVCEYVASHLQWIHNKIAENL